MNWLFWWQFAVPELSARRIKTIDISQAPHSVIEAMARYLITSNFNAHEAAAISWRTDECIASAWAAVADLLACHGNFYALSLSEKMKADAYLRSA
jgi:hypothetical protein